MLDEASAEILQGPSRFELQQGYPNPFNPTTTIRYTLAQESAAQITVFDILGQRVRTLAAGRHAAGQHQVQWQGDDDSGHRVAPGVYLYRLETEDEITTRRMVLLK